MTNKIRRTEIQIETRQVTIIRARTGQHSVYCRRCQASVTAFTPEQVAAFLRLVETGEIHLIDTTRGSFVCGNSLD